MADILQVNTELPADFTPTAPSGLTDEEAASRKPNISHHRPDKSTAQILAENLFTPFNGLNVALAVCLALVGSWRNMLFLGVVVSNTLIGTVQELRARKTIRKLSLLNAPTAHVLRNGQEKTVEGAENDQPRGSRQHVQALERAPAQVGFPQEARRPYAPLLGLPRVRRCGQSRDG